jgi:predicted RNA-binding Zn-ribbon protein involved in translation (DUF1610 family)
MGACYGNGTKNPKPRRSSFVGKSGTTMKGVVTIAPVAHENGLVAYECPKCGHVTSVLVPSTRP